MVTNATCDRDDLKREIVERIDVRHLLLTYGCKIKRGGGRNEWQSPDCPHERHKDADAFRFNEVKKRWQCFKCNVDGDVFTFIALAEGLDCQRDFLRVREIAASIADVDLNAHRTPEWQAAREQRERQREQRFREQMEREERDAANAQQRAAGYWDSLLVRHDGGERYLASRGLQASHLVDVVRFDHVGAAFADPFTADGSPSLRVFDFDHGNVCGIVRRRIPPIAGYKPSVKAPTLTGTMGTGTMGHRIQDIEPGGEVKVTEGIMDTLTSVDVFPEAVTLGANGTSVLPKVIFYAARRVRQLGARMTIYAHVDAKQQGEKAVLQGVKMAESLGMRFGVDIRVAELGKAKDLNEAWASRKWRPT